MPTRGIHLVGSVPLSNADTVFRSCGKILGNLLARYPDGETGNGRENWVQWLRPVVERHPAFELEPETSSPSGRVQRRYFRLKSGTNASDLTFERVGYATNAKASYDIFKRLRSEGVIPADARFQVSIPTPLAFLNAFIIAEERTAVSAPYTKALLAEVAEITVSIPSQDLSLQWDAVIEILILEGARPVYGDVPVDQLGGSLAHLIDNIPSRVQAGLHLCYGDFEHRHIVQPKDMAVMVELLNSVWSQVKRKLDFVHMPVPRERNDEAYFLPLRGLQPHPETELCLGLVHFTDGVEGTRKRLETAAKIVPAFTIAAECGFGRRTPETILPLLEIHRDAAVAG